MKTKLLLLSLAAVFVLPSCESAVGSMVLAPARYQYRGVEEHGNNYRAYRDEEGQQVMQLPMREERASVKQPFGLVNHREGVTWEATGPAEMRWVRCQKEPESSKVVLIEKPQGRLEPIGWVTPLFYQTDERTDSSAWWRYPLAGAAFVGVDIPVTAVSWACAPFIVCYDHFQESESG